MNFEEWERSASSLERELDTLLAQTMKVRVPAELIHRTIGRLPATLTAAPPWWAWIVYVGFFATMVLGLTYWQWEALAALASRAALVAPRAIVLAAHHPYLAAAVAWSFFVNAVMAWSFTAGLALRKRFAGGIA